MVDVRISVFFRPGSAITELVSVETAWRTVVGFVFFYWLGHCTTRVRLEGAFGRRTHMTKVTRLGLIIIWIIYE